VAARFLGVWVRILQGGGGGGGFFFFGGVFVCGEGWGVGVFGGGSLGRGV